MVQSTWRSVGQIKTNYTSSYTLYWGCGESRKGTGAQYRTIVALKELQVPGVSMGMKARFGSTQRIAG